MGYNSVVWGDSVTQETVGKTNSAGMTLVGDQVATDWKNDVGAHDLPAGVHRQQDDQRHDRGQRRPRQRGDPGPQEQERQGQDDPDHRPGRNPGRHGQRADRLPVRLGLQGRLPRGAGRRRPGDRASRGSHASGCAGQRHHHAAVRRHRQPAAGFAPGPDLGQHGQHGIDSDQGQVRRRRHAVQQGRSRCLHRHGIS